MSELLLVRLVCMLLHGCLGRQQFCRLDISHSLLYNYRTQKKRMFSLGCFTSVLILMLSGLFGVYVHSINIFWLFRCVPQCIPCFTFFTYHSFYPSPLSQGFPPCPLPPAWEGFILEQLKNSCIKNL